MNRPSYQSDNIARKFHLIRETSVPNNGSFRDGVQVKIVGFERWWNIATHKWLTTAILMYRMPRGCAQWRVCTDIITTMSYADHYHWLHDMAINPAVRYGKPGKRVPTYNQLTVTMSATACATRRKLRQAGF